MKQSNNTKVVFFGASHFVVPAIDFLKKEYDVQLVITTETHPTDAVPAFCKQHGIPFISVSTLKGLKSISHKLSAIRAPIAVLAYFGLIVPKDLIDIFPKGIVNIHPSLLPLYRGTTPGQISLLLGDAQTGVSIMLLDKEMDHGPILAQEKEDILPTDTSVTLYERLFAKGVMLLCAVLPAYLSGELTPIPQNHTKATFTKPLTRESGFLDNFKPISSELLDRLIRAYYPWPGVWCYTMINDKRLRIKFLPGKMLQVEGKKPVSYTDFIHGYTEGKEILKKLQLL